MCHLGNQLFPSLIPDEKTIIDVENNDDGMMTEEKAQIEAVLA